MPRGGAKPGERRGGRQLGTPNKTTAAVKDGLAALARKHTDAAIGLFQQVLHDPAAPIQCRLIAADKLLDRGYGKPAQTVTGADGAPLLPTIVIHKTS